MKQKDYQFKGFKFLRKASRFFAGLGLCLVVLTLLSLPKEKAVAATVYNNGDITFTTELLVDGKPDNLIRILKSGGKAVNLTVSLTVQARQNPSAITLGGSAPDKIATGNTIAGDVGILGIGEVLINSDQSNCSKQNLYDIPLFGTAKQYLKCGLNKPGYDGVMADTSTAKSIPVGQKQNYTFTIDNSVLSALKAGPNTTSSSTPFFQVAPWVQLNLATAVTQENWTVTDAGKQIYVQYFENPTDLQNAIDKNIRPQGIPEYGSNSNSASMGDSGSAILGFINQLINVLVGLIQQFVYYVFYLFIAPIIQAMLSIRTYTDTFAAVIYPGWEIVRNLCNILFIVALIAIGLGTLFRLESYQYKHLLVDLIIAAFLVNFSLVIAQVVLGVADTIQAQFLPNNVEVIRALARDLMAGWKNINFSNISQSGFFANTVAPLFELGLTLGSFVVFSAIAVFLFVRIIMLWVLLMLSPMAYAMRVLPQTKSYAGKWWGEFLKYAFFTPIMAFFLNMAAVINNTYSKTPVFQQILDHPELVGDSSIAQFVFKVGSNFIILVFLMVAIKVAEQAGVYGADAVSKAAQGGMFLPFKAAAGGGKLAGGFVGRKYNELTSKLRGDPNKRVTLGRAVAFAALNPVAWVKGMKHQSEERTHRAQAEAEAVGKEVAEQRFHELWNPMAYIRGSYKINPHVFQHAKHDEDEQAKNLANLTLQEVVKRAYEIALMPSDQEGRAYKRGVVKLTMSKGHIDDITENMHTTAEGRKMMEKFDEMIKKGWFEQEDVFQGAINPTTGKWQYTNMDEKGNLTFVGKDKRQVITQNDISRRAMYVAMFGGEIHRHKNYVHKVTGDVKHKLDSTDNPADYDLSETLDFHLEDHEADRLITQEGESEGLGTGHLEYMDMKYDTEKGEYQSYSLVKQDEMIDGKPTGRKMWVNMGAAQKQAVEIAKKNPRDQMHHMSPHSLMSSDGKSYYLANWKKVSAGVAEAPAHTPDRLADRIVMGWLPQEVHDTIRKEFQESHEKIINAYGPTGKTLVGSGQKDPATGKTYPSSVPIRIKLSDDDRLRVEAFAAENKRAVAGLFQKVLKNDGLLQNTLVDGRYEIEIESPSGVHKLELKG